MSKKLTIGKILGIIFCILAAAGTVVLLWANIYFGGQMKLIDKYYTALERDNYDSYSVCYPQTLLMNELSFAEEKEDILILQDNENIHVKTEFISREKFGNNMYFVNYKLTVYNDSENVEIEKKLDLSFYRGKWVLI